MINWLKKHWEVISYLIFGVLTTLLNILLYALFNRLFGYTAANSWGNVLDNILCILFAYATNRAFVFNSKTRGRAMAKEFGAFVTCRLNPETLMGITSTMVHTTDSSAAIAVIGGADGPTAIFVTGDLQSLWGMVVKVFSNVLVIVLNYVFSKLIIFKKK